MFWIKRIAWLLLWLGIAAGVAVEIVRGDELPASCPEPPAAVLLDFYSDWCGPCQAMIPTVEALVRAGYTVQRVNIDEDPRLAAQFGVSSIPCFVTIVDGRETNRVVGAASYQRLEAMLKGGRRRAEGGEVGGHSVVVRRQSPPAESTVCRRAPIASPPSAIRLPPSVPHPAWRYEQPNGHRAAVVRVFCDDGGNGSASGTRSIGSGTLVKWNGRLLVLTARHVVNDAKRIIVELCTKKTHWAKVLRVDAIWDCAVLELVGVPEGVEPAEIELGQPAMQREGDRLESCGYGPDGRLAVNSGVFLGYRRSSLARDGRDDWMVVSGLARGGDSGGPVFNRRGRLVGVLWGTDGKEVICVQAGRLHVLLDAAVGGSGSASGTREQQGAGNSSVASVHSPLATVERNPTPPRPAPLVSVPCTSGPAVSARSVPTTCGPGPCAPSEQTGLIGKPVLPWRGGAEQRDKAQAEQIDKLIELERIRADRESQPPPTIIAPSPEPPRVPPPEPVQSESEPSPLWAGLGVLVGIVVGFVVYFATQKST